MKTDKCKKKAAAKCAKAKAKIARKCGKAAKASTAVAVAALAALSGGCMGTSTPSRSQTLTISGCTINVYGGGTETGEVARVELATQAMSIENSGTETQTSSPTQTTDVKPDIDVRYNDAIAGASAASRSVLDLIKDGKESVLALMQSKETGTVEVTKTDGTTAKVECKDGQCSLCGGGDCAP